MKHRLKLNTQIYEEACEWFIDCRAGDLDDTTRHAFDCWLRKSPEHLRAYLELAAIWDEGPALDPDGKFACDTLIAQATLDSDNVLELPQSPERSDASKLDAVPFTAVALSGSAAELADPERCATDRRPHRFRRWRVAAIAATVVLGAAAVLYQQTLRAPSYTTAIGEQRSLALEDGSVVELNSRSTLVVHYSKRGRDVELLRGQALFRVAKDAARPFIVKTGATYVRAVGTEFDVYQKRDGTVVTVVEGQVAILTDHAMAQPLPGGPATAIGGPPPTNLEFPTIAAGRIGNIVVAAGEQLTVTPKVIQRAEHPNIASATAWTQRQLVFESASLAEVADEFNRYNDRQLVVGDARLETFHVSGVFSSTDPASLIRFLRARPELRIVETESEIRIEKRSS